MATSMDFLTSLSQPLVPNSPMVPPTTANTASAIPFTTMPNPPAPAAAPSSKKWMAITAIGALAFGLWYMGGGFGLGTGGGTSAPAKRRGRRRASRSRRSGGRRRRSRSRKTVTFGW